MVDRGLMVDRQKMLVDEKKKKKETERLYFFCGF